MYVIEIFSQTPGSTCEFWVNPVNFTCQAAAARARRWTTRRSHTQLSSSGSARAGTRRFFLRLSALRAHTKPPYRTTFMPEMRRPRKWPGAGPDGDDELRAQPVVDEIHPARGPPLSRRNPRGTGGSRAAAGGRKGAHVLPSTNIVALGSMKTLVSAGDVPCELLPTSVSV